MIYDVIVVGAGHAGCEAALSSARLGAITLLLTINPDTIAAMSCNPAIGGPAAKSHLVRELDALGGEMGKVIDNSYLNIRLINESRGPAVSAIRAQADKRLYQAEMTLRLAKQPNLQLKQGLVTELIVENGQACGVILRSGRKYHGKTVVITCGTFLNGQVVMGNIRYSGGRQGEPAANELSNNLKHNGLKMRRFQTATPPRVSCKSLDFSKMDQQPIQTISMGFSWDGINIERSQKPCWVTTTTLETINTIKENLHLSPIRSGAVKTKGPKFCPSIDRKVINFPDKYEHLIFVEPEGEYTDEMYLLGMTTAMPEEVQEKILKTIPGFEKAEIVRPGYAVEYDCLESFQFWASLESKIISHLFTAGQINGTSGYEEAAIQGLIAGINAAKKALNEPLLIIDRTTSYIGVLIDDLVTKGTEEPYRMMTSLAEFRLFFRNDNALVRLGSIAECLGLLNESQRKKRQLFIDSVKEFKYFIENTKVRSDAAIWGKLKICDLPERGYRLKEILLRTEMTEEILLEEYPEVLRFTASVRHYVWNEYKLEGYLERQKVQLEQARALEKLLLPKDFSFQKLTSLSEKAQKELVKINPLNLGQTLRIKELTDADRAILILLFNKNEGEKM